MSLQGPASKVTKSETLGLVLECALWARRVTPSVLVSAAGIEGDWGRWPWAPGLWAEVMQWRDSALQCCELASALIQKWDWKCKDQKSERGQAGIWLEISLKNSLNNFSDAVWLYILHLVFIIYYLYLCLYDDEHWIYPWTIKRWRKSVPVSFCLF